MRSLRHWTPTYIKDRLIQIYYERTHPDVPWLNRYAVSILNGWLRATDTALEMGSGRSTAWFAKRVGKLISLESDVAWYEAISPKLPVDVDYRLLSTEGANSEYVEAVRGIPDSSLDFALVDGALRDHCAMAVLPKLKQGAMLAIDDCHWFIPGLTRSPFSLSHESTLWRQIAEILSGWRSIWTSDGVKDTGFWFCPVN